MARFQQGDGALSSRNPESKTIAVRLTGDLVKAVEDTCAQQGITASEFLREMIHSWCYGGQSTLQEPSDGYRQARSMATQLATVAIQQALRDLPTTPEEATQMLGDFYNRRSG
jgi:hypothetical protein